MCMDYGFSFPAPGGDIIADLEVGDEITIKKGFGSPAAEDDTIDVVVAVHQFSALTASGVILGRNDGFGVEKTGRHLGEGEYEIGKAALAIWRAAEIKVALDDFSLKTYGGGLTLQEAIAIKDLLEELKGGAASTKKMRPN